jgi:hypothetical protein
VDWIDLAQDREKVSGHCEGNNEMLGIFVLAEELLAIKKGSSAWS